MRKWTLRAYRTSGGRDVLREWWNEQTETVRARFLGRLTYLLSADRLEWKREPFAPLSDWEGLGEIRFKADKVQHRPIGYFGPNPMEFTILICAIEKGSKFVPKQACSIADGRRTEIKADASKSVPCDWLWEDEDDDEEEA